MITFQIERVSDIIDELIPLNKSHWEEIAINQDKIELSVDYDKYIALDKAGILSVVTARDGDNLIGYCIDLVSNHLHYSNTVFAINDVVYILPIYRKASVGMRMIKFTEKVLIDIGAKVWYVHSKEHTPISSLLKRLGFNKIEENYGKYLGD